MTTLDRRRPFGLLTPQEIGVVDFALTRLRHDHNSAAFTPEQRAAIVEVHRLVREETTRTTPDNDQKVNT
jgi:hypothetical protein